MSDFVFILLIILSASLLCALLIVSAAIVSSRSTKRLAAKQGVDLTEDAQVRPQVEMPSTQDEQKRTSTRMAT